MNQQEIDNLVWKKIEDHNRIGDHSKCDETIYEWPADKRYPNSVIYRCECGKYVRIHHPKVST